MTTNANAENNIFIVKNIQEATNRISQKAKEYGDKLVENDYIKQAKEYGEKLYNSEYVKQVKEYGDKLIENEYIKQVKQYSGKLVENDYLKQIKEYSEKLTDKEYIKKLVDNGKDFIDTRYKKAAEFADSYLEKGKTLKKDAIDKIEVLYSNGKEFVIKNPMVGKLEKRFTDGLNAVPGLFNLPCKADVERLIKTVEKLDKKVVAMNKASNA